MTISLVHETLAFTHAHNNLQVVTPLMVIESTIDVQAFYTHTYILPVCNHRASFSMAYVSVGIRILHLYTLYFSPLMNSTLLTIWHECCILLFVHFESK